MSGKQAFGSNYLLGDVIGRGAMGTVYRAETRDGQPVAIKVLRDDLASQSEVVARFIQERQILRSASHKNVISVQDLVVEGDRLGIVMDLNDGGDMRNSLPRVLPTGAALDLVAQIASGLETVHKAGIVHRDLKPENVLITAKDGVFLARITDFGVSRLLGSRASAITSMVGTPNYMAPETSEGQSPREPADVYALGVMLYELLCGEIPFVAESPLAVLRAHSESQPPPIEGLPPEIWALVASMLEKSPDIRPTVSEIVAAAAALAKRYPSLGPFRKSETHSGGATSSRTQAMGQALGERWLSPDPAPQSEKESDKKRRGAWLGLITAVIFVGVAAGAWFLSQDDGAEPGPVVIPAVVGFQMDSAMAALDALGLTDITVSEVSSDNPAGIIISIDPIEGSPATDTTSVVLSVSIGQLAAVRDTTTDSSVPSALTDTTDVPVDSSTISSVGETTTTLNEAASTPTTSAPAVTTNTKPTTTTQPPATTTTTTTAPAAAPSAPSAPSATAGDAKASLSWGAANGNGNPILEYQVEAAPGSVKSAGTSSGYTYTSLTNGTSYTFRIRARNVAGWSNWSGWSSSVVPATVPGTPGPPTATAGNAQATISWIAPASNGSAINGYEIQSSAGTKTVTASPYTWTSLSNGTSYTFRIRAQNAVGWGPWSSYSSAVTPIVPATAPAKPGAPSATKGDARVSLSWGAPSTGGSPITHYDIQADTGADGSVNGTKTGITSTSYTWTGLSNGTNYRFNVRACNAVGCSSYSNWSNTVTPSRPPTINSFAVTDLSGNSVRMSGSISWAPGMDPITCTYYVNTTVKLSSQCGVSPSYTFTQAAGTYDFKLKVCNKYGDCVSQTIRKAITG